MADTTALFVFHADRGHFNWCIPLAAQLKSKHGVKCELWTNPQCEAWVPQYAFAKVCAHLGNTNLPAITGAYKAAASEGDTDVDGQRHLYANNCAGFVEAIASLPMVPESEGEAHGVFKPVSKKGAEAFKARLADPDVRCVVFECLWGSWARELALEAGKEAFGLMPSYREPYRAAYLQEPIWWGFDGELVRDQPDKPFFEGWPQKDASYVIADCLVGKATDCAGRRRFGPFIPQGDVIQDEDLRAWLDGQNLPKDQQEVTLIALGSQSALNSLSATAEADLLKGCLAASPRVLIASTGKFEDAELSAAQTAGRLRAVGYVPQWAALQHANVRCFVSHGGANSAHEALLSGTAVVPLPFFDDQFYVAMRLEELYCYAEAAAKAEDLHYTPLRKALLRLGGKSAQEAVACAVRLGLAVPEVTVKSLQKAVIEEDGVGTAAQAIAEVMRLA